MTHQEILQQFFSRTFENDLHQRILSDDGYEVPVDDIKCFMVALTEISLVEVFNYLDNHPSLAAVRSNEITECGALEAFTSELCGVLRENCPKGMSIQEIGKSDVFAKYLRAHNKQSWARYGSCQAKTAEQLGLAFKNEKRWHLSGFGYAYAFPYLTVRQQERFLCRALLRNTFYARVLLAVRSEEVFLTDYMNGLSASTQGRRSSSVTKMLHLCLEEMNREGIRWYDIHVPRYRAQTKTLVDHVLRGTTTALDTYNVSEDFFNGGIPLYTVKAACGYFDTNEVPEQEGWIDVSPSGVRANTKDYFVVYAKGDSMLPKIKDGDLCLFRWYKGEPLYDNIVLTQCRDYDAEYESSYTIKRFRQGAMTEGESRIVLLEPLNKEKYHSIRLSEDDGMDYKTVGIFVKVLK